MGDDAGILITTVKYKILVKREKDTEILVRREADREDVKLNRKPTSLVVQTNQVDGTEKTRLKVASPTKACSF